MTTWVGVASEQRGEDPNRSLPMDPEMTQGKWRERLVLNNLNFRLGRPSTPEEEEGRGASQGTFPCRGSSKGKRRRGKMPLSNISAKRGGMA